YITSEPIAARQKGSDPQAFLVADAGYNPYATVVVTRRALIDQKPDLVRNFVAATAEGWRAYLANPGLANDVMRKLNPTMDAAPFDAAVDAERPLILGGDAAQLGLGAMTRERWETLANQLAEIGLVDKPVPPGELYRQVLPNVAAALPPR